MKFLCVACDEPMKIQETRGPDDGSMSIVYRCGSCGHATAMLTNSMETQMVRSLGVTIGMRVDADNPMEMLRSSLSETRQGVEMPTAEAKPSASKCPFTHVVAEAFTREEGVLQWEDAAEERLAAIPEFVRPMVQKGIEEYAREKRYSRIDVSVMDEVKGQFGM